MLEITRNLLAVSALRQRWFFGAAVVLCVVAVLSMPGGAFAQGGGGVPLGGPPSRPVSISLDPPVSDEPRFDLRFEGGTVAQYLEAIQEASGRRNIVAMAGTDTVPMPPVALDNVNTQAAVSVLNGLDVEDEDGSRRSIGFYTRFDVVTVAVSVQRERNLMRSPAASLPVSRSTAVHGLAEMLLNGGYTIDAILSAIDVALDMSGDSGAKLRYHEETQMLFVYGTGLEHATVRSVLEQLTLQAQMMLGDRMMSEAERMRIRLEELDTQIEHEEETLGAIEVGSYNPIQNRIVRTKQRIQLLESQIVEGDAGPSANEEIAMEMRAVERATIELERVEAQMRDYRLRLVAMRSERDSLRGGLDQAEQE